MKCISCGKEIESTSGTSICPECNSNIHDLLNREWLKTSVQPDKPLKTGWICPICGRGMSPYESYCNCNSKEFTVSWAAIDAAIATLESNIEATDMYFDTNAVGNILD